MLTPQSQALFISFMTEAALNSFLNSRGWTVGVDGTITATEPGQQPVTIGRLKMITPQEGEPLVRGDDGLFRAANGDPLPTDETARLADGVLEGSNVNAVDTMVGMIAAARQFESQMKLLTTAETNDKTAAQLLSLS